MHLSQRLTHVIALQPAGLDEGPPAGDGGQRDDLVDEEDSAHGRVPRFARRYLGNMASADDLLGMSLLGVR